MARTLDLGTWDPGVPDRYNHRYFDRFSIVHAAVGAMFELARVPAPVAIGAQVAFEVVENDLKTVTRNMWPDWTPDGVENHLGDIAAFVVGYYGARMLKSSNAGGVALTGLAALAAAIWVSDMISSRRSTT